MTQRRRVDRIIVIWNLDKDELMFRNGLSSLLRPEESVLVLIDHPFIRKTGPARTITMAGAAANFRF